jgi:CheY-like chemotaxis protein
MRSFLDVKAAPLLLPFTMMASRILVVEDHPRTLENICAYLGDEGFAVEPASDGIRALEIFRNAPGFDLVICDIMLPELSRGSGGVYPKAD